KGGSLPYDLLLVDEASMVDVKIMAHLLKKVKTGVRLVFLGDPEQLPPVESGTIFLDLLRLNPSFCSYLETALRFENESIQRLAKLLDVEKKEELWKELSQGNVVQFFRPNSSKFPELFHYFLSAPFTQTIDVKTSLEKLSEFQIL